MIDIEIEQLVLLRDVPKILPLRPNGKRIHISAIYRWVQRGIRGCRLEVIRIGGTPYTSRQALQRFSIPSSNPQIKRTDPTIARKRRVEKAIKELDEMLRR